MKKFRTRLPIETPGYFKLRDYLDELDQYSTHDQRKHIMRLLNASDSYSEFFNSTKRIVHMHTVRGKESRLHESFIIVLKRLSELPGGLPSLAEAIEWVPDLELLFVSRTSIADLVSVDDAFIGAKTTRKYAKAIYGALCHAWKHHDHYPYEDQDFLVGLDDLAHERLALFDVGAFRAINAIAAAHSAFCYKKK